MATWTQVVQSGTVAAQFELSEPIGGPVWTAVSTGSPDTTLTDGYDLINKQSKGQFAYECDGIQNTTDWSDAEHLLATQDQGFLSALVSGTDIVAISWTQVVQSGTLAAQFVLPEPLGGPEWIAVTKDS